MMKVRSDCLASGSTSAYDLIVDCASSCWSLADCPGSWAEGSVLTTAGCDEPRSRSDCLASGSTSAYDLIVDCASSCWSLADCPGSWAEGSVLTTAGCDEP